MNRKNTLLVFAIPAVLLVLTMMVVTELPQKAVPFKSATEMLAFIAGAAVAIERIIEAFWTLLGGTLGTYWPLSWLRQQTEEFIKSLGETVETVKTQAERALAQVEGTTQWASEQLPRVKSELETLTQRINQLGQMAPDHQRIQLTVASVATYINGLDKAYGDKVPELKRALTTTQATIDGLQNFLASFKDNPGRRLISIFLGAILGVGVAGACGLDMLPLVLEGKDQSVLGVLLTGVLIGLGSGPTHEVIRAIQEYKKNRKGENTATPDLP